MLEAIDLSKRYPSGKLALDAFNLRLDAGEVYCLLGAHAAGKTTVLNLLLGFVQPTAGRVRVDGIDVHGSPEQARRHLAFIPSAPELYPRLTPRQMLELLDQIGGGPDHDLAEFEMAMREVGIPERAFTQRLGELGPGLRQRLCVAAASLKGASVVLLDEPSAGLDVKEASELAENLAALREQGKAILIATQGMFWARHLADQVGILQEGRKVLSVHRTQLRDGQLEGLYLDYLRGDLDRLAG